MRRIVCAALALSLTAAELPVRQVVLYKNGVGYFERAGDVKPGEAAQLAFKQSEMNDILKSLTVRDSSGNIISGLRYESAEPIEQKLATFPFTTSDDKPSLSAFLNRLQGSRLTVVTGADKITGLILLARAMPGGERQAEREQVVLVLDTGEMRTIDLSSVTSLQFADMALQDRLRDYLRVLAGSHSADKRLVTVDSEGKTVRSLTASYMVPAPVWKSSYRLIFGTGGEPTLEGWAIVDNATGENWNSVKLALVSGRPVSFISNLFEQRTVHRQVAELPESEAVNPVLYESGVAGGVVGGVPGRTPGGVIGGIIGAVPSAAPPPPPPSARFSRSDLAMPKEVHSSVNVTAAGAREFADLFEYTIGHPVTVRAGESTMLPFLQEKIGGRKLLIYSNQSSPHPMSSVELTNSTGKTLDGGPITVFEGASYAGEALMSTLKGADKRLISYAVDLGTQVATKLDSGTAEVREVHLRHGLLTTRHAQRMTQVYTIKNIDPRAKTLVIEHPIRPQHKLLNVKPAESTPNNHRFEVKLAARSEDKFVVTEEREFDSTTAISDGSGDFLVSVVANRSISEAGRKALQQLVAMQRKLSDLQQQIRQTETDIQNLSRDQDRTRQNLMSLNQVSGQQELVQRYARQLADQENRLGGLRTRQADLTMQRSTLDSEFRTLLSSTEF